MKINDFDSIAGVYDFLAMVVFGRAILKSQKVFLQQIQENSKILIVGGGSGKILEFLDEEKKDLAVDYVEPSVRMIGKAKNRRHFKNIHVNFINETLELKETKNYDVIITHFFLDLFTEQHLFEIMKGLSFELKNNGHWMFADFIKSPKIGHKILTWLMFRFFRLCARLESQELPDYDRMFRRINMTSTSIASFYGGMIRSVVYRKFD